MWFLGYLISNYISGFHNFDIDAKYMPAGIAAWEEVELLSLKDNACSGIMGPAFEFQGEECDESEGGQRFVF